MVLTQTSLANTDPALEINGLGKRFPDQKGRGASPWIIRDLSFSVRQGEFVTILGPSGAGKSTLLNLLSHIEMPSEGTIRVLGETLASNGPGPGLGCRIGYVAQDDNLMPWRTTLQNVMFPLEVQKRLDAKSRAHAEELIAAVGLKGFENYYPHELSGGMRKRASLIRTLVYDPPIILMDEPFGAVDAQTRTQLQIDLLRLWEMGRKTIIFITHDIAEAIALGDRTLVLTRSPARIAREFAIPLPRPRDVADIYAMSGFSDVYAAIREQVR